MFFTILAILAPVFIVVGIGYIWTRKFGGFESAFVSKLVMNVFAPALIIHALTTTDIALPKILSAGGIMILCMAIAGVLGFLLLRFLKQSLRVYLPALMFPNLGNIGSPICFFAFGAEGLTYGITLMTAMGLCIWTFGLWITSGEISPKKALTTPPLLAAVSSLTYVGLGLEVPEWGARTLELMAGTTFPLMLMLLGASLATMKMTNVRMSLGFSVFRIFGGFAIGLGVTELLQVEGVLRGVIILQASMPPAVFNVLFAQMYNRRPEEVAGVIFMSTLLATITLPFIVAFVLATS